MISPRGRALIQIALFMLLPGTSCGLGQASQVPADSPARRGGTADATTLYNAGTIALERGQPGPAVTFLLAASRLEPRAPDVRSNLAGALAAASRAAGGEEGGESSGSGPFSIAMEEAWWFAAILLAFGAAIGLARHFREIPRAARWTGMGLICAGVLLSAVLHLTAWQERIHPEAVVIVPSLSVERGLEEPSRPAVLLAAGERVRLGETRGGLVEIRVGDTRIGWAAREGLWRVADAARYTSQFRPG